MNNKKFLYLLLSILLLERILLVFFLPVEISKDTSSYTIVAQQIVSGNVNSETFLTRTPIYPLFVAGFYKLGVTDWGIQLFQHLLGFIGILIIISLIKEIKIKTIAAGLFCLDVQALLYEHSIISDFLFSFLIIIFVYSLYCNISEKKEWFGFLASIILGLAILTKPVLQYFLLFFILLLVKWLLIDKYQFKNFLKSLFVLLLPALIIIFGWSYRNYKVQEHFGLSLLSGVAIMEVAEKFIDYSSSFNTDIKNKYKLRLLEKRNPRHPVSWLVYSDILRENAYSKLAINSMMISLAAESVLKNPLSYAKHVVGELLFFFFSNDSILNSIAKTDRSSVLMELRNGNINAFIKKLVLNSYLFHFLILSGFVLYFFMRPSIILAVGDNETSRLLLQLMLLVIGYIALFSCVFNYGLPRYRVAVQPLIVLFSSYGLNSLYLLFNKLKF